MAFQIELYGPKINNVRPESVAAAATPTLNTAFVASDRTFLFATGLFLVFLEHSEIKLAKVLLRMCCLR